MPAPLDPSQSRAPSFAEETAHDPGLEPIGSIVRLQIQTHSLKRGERPRSWYDPAGLRSLNALWITAGGVIGIDDDTAHDIGDVHHRDHPASKYRGANGVSLGFTSHYGRMRDRFGNHVRDGVAGENIIVGTDHLVTDEDLRHGVVIVTDQGPVSLGSATIAKPCVEFSKFCAGYGADQLADGTITEALQFLFDGTRGFYITYDAGVADRALISVGDPVYRRRNAAS